MPTNDEIKKRAAELDGRLKQKRASARNTSAAAGADDSEIKRLAALGQMQYESERKAAAKKLGVRSSILDRLVQAERAKNGHDDDGKPGHAVEFPEPEPWDEPVQGAELLDEIANVIRSHIVMPDHSGDICALWAVHTYLLDQFLITPRLAIYSPMKGCGKTTLLDVLEHLVLKPLKTSSVTASVTFRVIEAKRPTMLIDEAKHIGDKTDLLEVLNDGHRRGGRTLRNVAVGDDYEPRAFSTHSALAIALIGTLPPELHDRSVVVNMERRLPNEPIEPFRPDRSGHLDNLARKAVRWTKDHVDAIADADPPMPSGVFNREADNWRPLLAIADAAGGGWSKRARDAAIKSHAAADADDHSRLELLLADIKDISRGKTAISSADLVTNLVALEGHPWAEMGQAGKPLTQNKLARMLKPLSIIPQNVWIGENKVLKGYVFAHFEDAFTRYLPPEGGFKPLGRYDADEMGISSGFQTARPETDLAVEKCKKPNNDGHPSALAVQKGGDSKKPAIDAQKTPSGHPGDIPSALRRCVHCGKPGAEPWDHNGRAVDLHGECLDAWADQQERRAPANERKAAKETNKTNGKPNKASLVPALDEADSDALARFYAGVVLEDEGGDAKADTRLRWVLAELVPPEAVEREYDRVMQAIDRLAGDDPPPHDGARLQ